MSTIEQLTIEALKEKQKTKIWFGDVELWEEIYSKSTGRCVHPVNKWHSICAALRKSKYFERKGYIKAIGWSGTREINHPVFEMKLNS